MLGQTAVYEMCRVEKILKYHHLRCCQIIEDVKLSYQGVGSFNLAGHRIIVRAEETWLVRPR